MAEVVRLQVLEDYLCRQVNYKAGTIIEVDPEQAQFLLRDAPGCFEKVLGKGLEKPPADKSMKAEQVKKK